MKEQMKLDKKLIQMFGLDHISHLIRNTSKGPLSLLLRKESEEYEYILDAVPVGKDEAKELKKLLENGN